jgi:hypothetical protein
MNKFIQCLIVLISLICLPAFIVAQGVIFPHNYNIVILNNGNGSIQTIATNCEFGHRVVIESSIDLINL